MKKININHEIRVKLTDYGRHLVSDNPTWKYNKVDEAGWTTVQLWVLMYELGPYLMNGGQLPFETCIEINDAAVETV